MDSAGPTQSHAELPPAARLTEMIFGFMISQAIAVAANLGIADLLGDGPKHIDELARRAGAHSGALYRLMRALASVGVFAEEGERRFRLSALAEPLRADAPGSLRAFSMYMSAGYHMNAWGELLYSVRHGAPAFDYLNRSGVFEYFQRNPADAEIFNNAMTSLSSSVAEPIVSAYDFSGISKLVDVGGGHGYLLCSVLRRYPRMSGILYDAESVTRGATSVVRQQGVGDRCELAAGDFFQSVPAGADAYMMKHIIHDWDDEKSARVLGNCHRAMDPKGRVLVIEMVVPEGNVPSPSKLLDLEMLLFLRGYERTEKEFRALFRSAGFELTRVVPTETPYSIIEGVKL
jgi:hypothetical protein